MSHGSGGKDMRDLIDSIFVSTFSSAELDLLEDQARFEMADLLKFGDQLAFTTDSYVVDPIFFPGGDIGTLSVNGTVNDIAVSGAIPLYLSCGLIIEEGFLVEDLRRIAVSMKAAADKANIKIVTGDTKVVERKAADKIFINTAGIGVIPKGLNIGAKLAKPGDIIIVNGYVGDHGAAIVSARNDLSLETKIRSDCQALNHLIAVMTKACPQIHCLRDATRGGIATVLNEFAQSSRVCIAVDESSLPIREEVRGLCEILGIDPLYLANEGKLIAIVEAKYADQLLDAMKAHPSGTESVIIGEVRAQPEDTVLLKTTFGAERILDMLVGEQLPRIC